ncbi:MULTISPECIES: signal peptidase I SipW [unclassified Bacillus (in: firmicutes)]|uniref:signal peptidase I SipW n=1 Tax=unclassified Bacillus (in: firmicutes) TaxID=185979 RepID=UPI0008E8E6D1|nr:MULTISPECIES: signal peptidase I [unclassified Bacillus (in: firmicutes)]SFB13450.1 signal peptidase, endoplasmic reticulum-type [Bacillus sp. UNCCL13]SFQ90013.1 signal peptidase, endoplasmic reticulum-type [Bacillus sp. cl95]
MKVKKVFSNLITLSLILLLILMVYIVVSSKLAGGEPQAFGYQFKTVLSGSMEPGIKTGSIIVVKPVDENTKYEKDDIITFKVDEKNLVTHRIVEVVKNANGVMYRTKGDNNKSEDMELVLSQNVVAKYVGINIPYLGYLTDYAKSQNGSALLLILPGLLLIGYSIVSIWRTISQIEKATNNKVEKSA